MAIQTMTMPLAMQKSCFYAHKTCQNYLLRQTQTIWGEPSEKTTTKCRHLKQKKKKQTNNGNKIPTHSIAGALMSHRIIKGK